MFSEADAAMPHKVDTTSFWNLCVSLCQSKTNLLSSGCGMAEDVADKGICKFAFTRREDAALLPHKELV